MINTKCICGKTHKTDEEYINCYTIHADRVDWYNISRYQHLSEEFITAHADRVDWAYISKYQHLSEEFIHAHAAKVDWDWISAYQHLSEEFITAHANKIKISLDNMSYWTEENRTNYINDFCKKYNLENHKDYIIAYKSIRHDNYSNFNFTIKYSKGETIIDKNCNCNINEENSFGLSAWNKENAKAYFPEGKLIKVKIFKKDIGCVLINTGKIRCFKQTVL